MRNSRIGSYLLGYTAGTVFVLVHMAVQGVRARRSSQLAV